MTGLSEQREAEIRERDSAGFKGAGETSAWLHAELDRRELLAAYDERGKEIERLRDIHEKIAAEVKRMRSLAAALGIEDKS